MPVTQLTIPHERVLFRPSKGDEWTVQDSLEGTVIFGANGTGKSTASGTAIACSMLHHGFGGVIFTVKTDEREFWTHPKRGLCAKMGRLKDVLVLSVDSGHQFDFLEYELQRTGSGAGDTSELARLFTTVLEAGGQGGSNSSDPYWSRALDQLLKNGIELARFATGRVSLNVLSTIVHEAPLSIAETSGEDWQALVRSAKASAKTEMEKRNLELTLNYFNREFPRLNDRTRSSIVSIFTSMADVLLRGKIGSIFSQGKVTLTPELSHQGKIILIDLPVKEYGETGRFAQLIFKYVWQKAAERRDKSQPILPMFLWCDESQELVTGYDAAFQATARSSGIATVYLTQNLRNYHARLGGGAKAEAETDSLLGNLSTKIFHANGDPTTNEWAERIIGKAIKQHQGGSIVDQKTTTSWNQSVEPTVPAKSFTTLRKGSKINKGIVEAIMFQTGRLWAATNDNYLRAAFEQPVE